jgi:hypothetical protein
MLAVRDLWWLRKNKPTARLLDLESFGDCPIVSTRQLAKVLDITTSRIRQLVILGMPRLRACLYPLYDCIHWYCRYSKTIGPIRKRGRHKRRFQAARARYQVAKAELYELRAQWRTGEFVNEELIHGRKLLVSAFDRILSYIVPSIRDELKLPEEAVLVVRDLLDRYRDKFVGESEYFSRNRDDSWLRP